MINSNVLYAIADPPLGFVNLNLKQRKKICSVLRLYERAFSQACHSIDWTYIFRLTDDASVKS